MTISEAVEVESKFEVGPHTPRPTADALAPLVVGDPVVHRLSATYFDTEDLALTRHKVTLRRRTGGDDAGWHLKLPSAAGRLELHVPFDEPHTGPDGGSGPSAGLVPRGGSDDVPSELVAAVAGLVRRRPLAPVARVDNERHLLLLMDDTGTPVVEFCDDHVSTKSYAGTEGGGDWREWEAEIVDPEHPDATDHLQTVATACVGAGASASSSSSKLARAIGPLPATRTPGVSAVRDTLADDLNQLLDHDPGARRGTMVGVHQMRVAVRGLRSTISSHAAELEGGTTGTAIDPAGLLAELKVLAAVLGKVRDVQVVDERLAELSDSYPEDVVSPATRHRIRTELDAEETRARRRVEAALASDRYLDLLDRLHDLVEVAGTGPDDRDDTSDPTADRPVPRDGVSAKRARREAEETLLRGVDRQFAKFTKVRTRTERDLESLDLTLAQREELTHVVRKRAKALRRGVNSLPADTDLTIAPLRTACQRLHSVLGDVQDSVTARAWIRRIARRAEAAGESTFGFGVLFAHERGHAERALAGFESDAATVTAAYRELSVSRRAAQRRRKGKKKR